MARNYISDPELTAAVKAALGVQPADSLSGEWAEVIRDAAITASNDINQSLLSIGHTQDTIAAWDSVRDFARDLGTFWALTRGAGLGGYSAPQLKNYDRRDDLRKLTVLVVGGVPVAPVSQASAVGGISHGRSKAAESAACRFDRLSGNWGHGW